MTLSTARLAQFERDGYVKLENAFPGALATQCRELVWQALGLSPDHPQGWTEPLAYVWDCPQEPFRRAANTPALHEAFDQLVGPGRWVPRQSLGWFCVRFPGGVEPPDLGWHVDGSYPTSEEGVYGLNLASRGRALLMLFLFSEVTVKDAPTMLRVGSHLDVPRLLLPSGQAGTTDRALLPQLDVSAGRPVSYAIGEPGDVYLCHPFLVHSAQPHYGDVPRFLAQPSLGLTGEMDVTGPPKGPLFPVAAATRRGLAARE